MLPKYFFYIKVVATLDVAVIAAADVVVNIANKAKIKKYEKKLKLL